MAAKAPVAFNVSGDKVDKSGPFGERLQKATGHFKKILNRDPTEQEIERIGTFIAAPRNSQMMLMEGDAPVSVLKMTNPNSTAYSLYFKENTDTDSTKGNVGQAVAWFEKFNGRKPSQEETIDIQKFMNQDK